jgi:HPt (histidine-containing phosphotransfer) domain-containing protein
VPIVALTAHDAVNFRSRVLDARMDDILSKPYSLDECMKVLRRWIPDSARAGTRVAGSPAIHSGANAEDAARAAVVGLPEPLPVQPRTLAEQPTGSTLPRAPLNALSSALASVDANAVAALKKLRGGAQTDLYSRLVELFRTGSVDSLTQLGTALHAGDLRAAAAACHKLAASAGNVGALAYAKQLRELEHVCAGGQGSGAGEIYQALQAAHAPLIDALVGHTMRASA